MRVRRAWHTVTLRSGRSLIAVPRVRARPLKEAATSVGLVQNPGRRVQIWEGGIWKLKCDLYPECSFPLPSPADPHLPLERIINLRLHCAACLSQVHCFSLKSGGQGQEVSGEETKSCFPNMIPDDRQQPAPWEIQSLPVRREPD